MKDAFSKIFLYPSTWRSHGRSHSTASVFVTSPMLRTSFFVRCRKYGRVRACSCADKTFFNSTSSSPASFSMPLLIGRAKFFWNDCRFPRMPGLHVSWRFQRSRTSFCKGVPVMRNFATDFTLRRLRDKVPPASLHRWASSTRTTSQSYVESGRKSRIIRLLVAPSAAPVAPGRAVVLLSPCSAAPAASGSRNRRLLAEPPSAKLSPVVKGCAPAGRFRVDAGPRTICAASGAASSSSETESSPSDSSSSGSRAPKSCRKSSPACFSSNRMRFLNRKRICSSARSCCTLISCKSSGWKMSMSRFATNSSAFFFFGPVDVAVPRNSCRVELDDAAAAELEPARSPVPVPASPPGIVMYCRNSADENFFCSASSARFFPPYCLFFTRRQIVLNRGAHVFASCSHTFNSDSGQSTSAISISRVCSRKDSA
mmetsp:Transcript_19863/g.50090  ORF Transcript_19863/g.50090 Transcript_19863/m.50090 type:complete len:427 (+) Transcript_19863:4077-5357(+)